MSDDLTTLAGVESRLRQLVTDLTLAQQALAKTRDDEVRAKHVYEASRRAALLSEDCPKVARGMVTTADRDAWVDEQVKRECWLYELAEVKREAAQDHLRVLRDQAMIVMSLGKSVQAAFQMSGAA
ncbi:hypothetical protein [Microbispora sp. KK1-11]|uniref:hypothetical protein n=1 Tax=Microbispora sp. KK1-11 TaxID=2053005 RepID=UPI001158B9C0|nr:hypothetical protein [Microbispora sp. KK1-11]TQS30009.1 hypothetical protein FLW16_06510 [Microbispora sp. KK1-11]